MLAERVCFLEQVLKDVAVSVKRGELDRLKGPPLGIERSFLTFARDRYKSGPIAEDVAAGPGNKGEVRVGGATWESDGGGLH